MRSAVFCSLALVCSLAIAENSGSSSIIQPTARPLGLQPISLTKAAKSDSRSIEFDGMIRGQLRTYLQGMLVSGREFMERQGLQLNSSMLFLTSRTPYPVRVYFVTEGAGYQNSIGFSVSQAGATKLGPPSLVFPNASMPVNSVNFMDTNFGTRVNSAPVLPGDYVDLGTMYAGTQLDFFLISDGARGGTTIYTNKAALNHDKFQHVWASAIPKSPFLIIGFEDLPNGGDKDYDDVVIVVDIGRENLDNLVNPDIAN